MKWTTRKKACGPLLVLLTHSVSRKTLKKSSVADPDPNPDPPDPHVFGPPGSFYHQAKNFSQRHGSADPDPDPDPPQNVMDPQPADILEKKVCFKC